MNDEKLAEIVRLLMKSHNRRPLSTDKTLEIINPADQVHRRRWGLGIVVGEISIRDLRDFEEYSHIQVSQVDWHANTPVT
ncbi:MAG: hypothetical protein ACLPVO_15420 [Desulfomonilaceae bacterium]